MYEGTKPETVASYDAETARRMARVVRVTQRWFWVPFVLLVVPLLVASVWVTYVPSWVQESRDALVALLAALFFFRTIIAWVMKDPTDLWLIAGIVGLVTALVM